MKEGQPNILRKLRKGPLFVGIIAAAISGDSSLLDSTKKNPKDTIAFDTRRAATQASSIIRDGKVEPKAPISVQDESKITDELPQLLVSVDRDKIYGISESLRLRYGVAIKFVQEKISNSHFTLEPVVDGLQTAKELEALKAQLVKVPPEFFNKLGIGKIVFVEKATDHTPKGDIGFVAAAPVGEDLLYMVKAWPFYHELFHVIDGKFAGGLGSDGSSMSIDMYKFHRHGAIQNNEWLELEPDKMNYDADEDQAEYCRVLFNLDDGAVYQEQYLPLLQNKGQVKKLERMKMWLFEISEGLFDENYWRDLRDGKVNEGYWETIF